MEDALSITADFDVHSSMNGAGGVATETCEANPARVETNRDVPCTLDVKAPSRLIPDAVDALGAREHSEGDATETNTNIPFIASQAQPMPAQLIEALLFASDTPLSAARIADIIENIKPVEVELHIATLNDRYVASGASFRITSIARGYQLMTLPVFAPWLAKLDKQRSQSRLTGATLEVLAITAYKQPIIRADIEAIRGVACGEVLNRLREMGLIKIVGRAEIVGRPLMYGTTKKFLEVFGLSDLDELPPMEALTLRRSATAANEEPAPLRAVAGT